jgi:hypothetical protein
LRTESYFRTKLPDPSPVGDSKGDPQRRRPGGGGLQILGGSADPRLTARYKAFENCMRSLQSGQRCVGDPDFCESVRIEAVSLIKQADQIRAQMEVPCSIDAFGPECGNLVRHRAGVVSQYKRLRNEAPSACQALLPLSVTPNRGIRFKAL